MHKKKIEVIDAGIQMQIHGCNIAVLNPKQTKKMIFCIQHNMSLTLQIAKRLIYLQCFENCIYHIHSI